MLPDGRQLRQIRALYALSTLPPTLQRLTSRPIARQPTGTLATVFIMIVIHALRYVPGGIMIHNLSLRPLLVLRQRELWRLFTSALVHVDIAHLSLNCTALLSVGPRLEADLGTVIFVCVLIFMAIASSVIYCILSTFSNKHTAGSVVGFSAVLFALMPLSSSHRYDHRPINFGGISIPSQYRHWTELLRTQLLLPDASMLGHFSGLVAGYTFVALRSSLRKISYGRQHAD